MNPTKRGAVVRGILIVTVAMLTAVVTDEYLRQSLPRWVFSAAAVLVAGLINLRAYIDQSISQSKAHIEPMEAPDNVPAG